MSLINEVLRDLDVRHAAESERVGLAKNVKALPTARPSFWSRLIWPALAACVSGAIVWLLVGSNSPPAPPTLTPVTPIVQAQAPAASTSAISPELPAPVVTESVPLKLDVEIASSVAPEPPVVKLPISKPIAPPEVAQAAVPLPVPPVVKVAADKTTGKPADPKPAALKPLPGANAPAQISKQPTGGGSLNEQAEAEYRRGLNAARRGDGSEASDAYRAAIKLQNNHIQARQALLSLLVEQRQWAAVEVLALDSLGLLPQRHDWALLAARVQFDRGEVGQALDTLSLHASYARGNPDYQVFYALLLQRAGRYAEAVSCYQIALAINPNEGRWWYGLARALEADHREPEARQAYEKARASGNLPPDLAQAVERRLH